MNTREATREYRIAQWTQIFQERKISGETIQAFCESKGISRDMYYRWQRIVRAAACEQLAVKRTDAISNGATGFAKVCVAEQAALPSTVELSGICSEPDVRIEYGNVRIRISGGYEPSKMAQFVRELARP